MERSPWYAAVNDATLRQGDIFERCPIVVPTTPAFPDQVEPPDATYRIEADQFDENVVVMTQSCDLEQDKVELIMVCPLLSLTDIEKDNPGFKSNKMKEKLRQGNIPGYHMIAASEVEGARREIQVVDFHSVYSIPRVALLAIARKTPGRLRLLAPYREHLSQAFARFFMRVGLPSDIPRFTS